jgi:hypothetical protein
MLDDMVHVMLRHRSVTGPSPVRHRSVTGPSPVRHRSVNGPFALHHRSVRTAHRAYRIVHHLDLDYSLQNYLRAGFTEMGFAADFSAEFSLRDQAGMSSRVIWKVIWACLWICVIHWSGGVRWKMWDRWGPLWAIGSMRTGGMCGGMAVRRPSWMRSQK